MSSIDLNVRLDVTGVAGPARSEAESEADQEAGLAAIGVKRARLRDLAAMFEEEGATRERARVLAALAYAQEST